MWLILQADKPEDFVLATGKTTTIRDFARMAFLEIGVELKFIGKNENEIGVVERCNGDYKLDIGKTVIQVDPNYYRPTEVDLLIGDASKANNKLGWKPKITLSDLVKEMVESDINNYKKNNLKNEKS